MIETLAFCAFWWLTALGAGTALMATRGDGRITRFIAWTSVLLAGFSPVMAALFGDASLRIAGMLLLGMELIVSLLMLSNYLEIGERLDSGAKRRLMR